VVSLSDREISADIIESCRSGDREAFRTLYEAYKDKVYSISLYFFHGDTAAASDATQQVFLKLITSIQQFRGEAGFSTWLYRLVVNTCTDSIRQRKSHPVPADRFVLQTQEKEYAQHQMASSVRLAVSTLPPKFRLVVLLRYFEDLSYEEMAKVLNCSIGTVSSRLSRGHQLLAEKLTPLKGWFTTRE
jgi:RNA polymerase sigma-70 factor (ECF subfamily)